MPGCGPTGVGVTVVTPLEPTVGAAGRRWPLIGVLGGLLGAVQHQQHPAAGGHLLLVDEASACGRALPREPPKVALTPMFFRIATALPYGSPTTLYDAGIGRVGYGRTRAEQGDRAGGEHSGAEHNKLLHVDLRQSRCGANISQ